MDKFKETYEKIAVEISNKKAKKNVIKEQIEEREEGSLPPNFDRNAPFYEIEISIPSYSDMGHDYFDDYESAREAAEKDYAFLSQFAPIPLRTYSTPAGFGWIYRLTIPREKLLEFAMYGLFGDENYGEITIMTNTNLYKEDISEDTSLDEIFDNIEINKNDFEDHFTIMPKPTAGKTSPRNLKKFKDCFIDIDEESWADDDDDDEE